MITINGNIKTITGDKYRLIHDNTKVLALIDGSEQSKTTTIHEVEEFETEQQAIQRIEDLGLEYEKQE